MTQTIKKKNEKLEKGTTIVGGTRSNESEEKTLDWMWKWSKTLTSKQSIHGQRFFCDKTINSLLSWTSLFVLKMTTGSVRKCRYVRNIKWFDTSAVAELLRTTLVEQCCHWRRSHMFFSDFQWFSPYARSFLNELMVNQNWSGGWAPTFNHHISQSRRNFTDSYSFPFRLRANKQMILTESQKRILWLFPMRSLIGNLPLAGI